MSQAKHRQKRKICKFCLSEVIFVNLATLKRKIVTLRKIVKFGTEAKIRKIRCIVQSWPKCPNVQCIYFLYHCEIQLNSLSKKGTKYVLNQDSNEHLFRQFSPHRWKLQEGYKAIRYDTIRYETIQCNTKYFT